MQQTGAAKTALTGSMSGRCRRSAGISVAPASHRRWPRFPTPGMRWACSTASEAASWL